MVLRQRRECRAVNHLQRGDAEHIQRALSRGGIRLNVSQPLAPQAVHDRAIGHHVGVKIEIDMEPEGGAPVRLTVEGDIPTHLFHQLLGDNQTQPGTAMAPRDAGIRLTKCLEQPGLIALGDANAGVADLYFYLHFSVTERAFLHQDVDIAAFGKFDGIAHQIRDHLL